MGVSTYPATAVSAIYLAPAYPLIFAFSVYAIVFQGLFCAERLKPLIGFRQTEHGDMGIKKE
jgi:hypothetical protein